MYEKNLPCLECQSYVSESICFPRVSHNTETNKSFNTSVEVENEFMDICIKNNSVSQRKGI